MAADCISHGYEAGEYSQQIASMGISWGILANEVVRSKCMPCLAGFTGLQLKTVRSQPYLKPRGLLSYMWAIEWPCYRILPNKSACLNKHAPRRLNLPCYISKIIEPILFTFSAHNVRVFSSSHSQFHWNHTRIKIHFLPPRPARLFGEIRYL